MASLKYQALILAHYSIPVPEIRAAGANGAITVTPATTRAAVIGDIPSIPDTVTYDLAKQYNGVTRGRAAFDRYLFDRGATATVPAAITAFWTALEAKTAAQIAAIPKSYFDESARWSHAETARKAAFAAVGETLASDYMRATERARDGNSPADYVAALAVCEILGTVTPYFGSAF